MNKNEIHKLMVEAVKHRIEFEKVFALASSMQGDEEHRKAADELIEMLECIELDSIESIMSSLEECKVIAVNAPNGWHRIHLLVGVNGLASEFEVYKSVID